MQQWEYVVLRQNYLDMLQTIETIGKNGWELVNAVLDNNGFYTTFFKRPLVVVEAVEAVEEKVLTHRSDKYIWYHDESFCNRADLDKFGDCPVCKIHPDTQSVCGRPNPNYTE